MFNFPFKGEAMILVVAPGDNNSGRADNDLIHFCNRLEEKKEVLVIKDPARLLIQVALCGYEIEKVVVKFDDETDLPFATLVNGFFGNCAKYSLGRRHPEGYLPVRSAQEVLA
ncbi:hypothetical protein KW786_03265 [Candidatus Parcubacteria bacterium]|nr:hypothetical protein [Candidatus Parcubacteria bacterium]